VAEWQRIYRVIVYMCRSIYDISYIYIYGQNGATLPPGHPAPRPISRVIKNNEARLSVFKKLDALYVGSRGLSCPVSEYHLFAME